MSEPLEHLLRLVSEGRLTAEEATPLLEALRRQEGRGAGRRTAERGPGPALDAARTLRVEVRERGRIVVDLRIPGTLAGLAAAVPGLPPEWADRIREALAAGVAGPVVDLAGHDGDGVSVRIE